jgi:hypothetical protein
MLSGTASGLPGPGWWWAAGAAALLGVWLAPLPEPVPALVKPRADGWALPALPRVFDQTSLAANVSAAPFWGAAPPALANPAGAPLVDPRWRIAAIFGQGQQRGVLVVFAADGKPALRLAVGDRLPSGHRIAKIDDRDLCIQIGSRLYRLGVERSAI